MTTNGTKEKLQAILGAINTRSQSFLEAGALAHRVLGTYVAGMGDSDMIRSLAGPTSIAGGSVLQGLVNNAFLRGFTNQNNTINGCYRVVGVPNFLPMHTFAVGSAARLSKYTRGRVAEHGTFSLEGQSWQMIRYALDFTVEESELLDRQPIDLMLIAVEEYGAAAQDMIGNQFWRTIYANPQTPDSGLLFNSTAQSPTGGHANLTNVAFSTSALDTALQKFCEQVRYDAQGHPVNINNLPYKLFVTPKHKPEADRFVRLMKQDRDTDLQVVSETRLKEIVDPVTGNDDSFLLAGSADASPAILIGGLSGSLAPRLTPYKLEHGRWGQGFGIVQDIGAAAQRHIGLYYSTGA